MRATLLPAARDLSAQENAQLAAADQRATGVPYAALAVALVAALLLVAGQLWLARRTNRILNPGLLVASLVGLVSLIWLVTALTVARTHLIAARDHGSAPVEALARAETAALQAHADESLTLINRDTFADDLSQADFVSQQKRLGPGPGTLLTDAAAIARGSRGGPQAAAALGDAPTWYIAHQQVRSLDDSGQYRAAVGWALGNSPADSGCTVRRTGHRPDQGDRRRPGVVPFRRPARPRRPGLPGGRDDRGVAGDSGRLRGGISRRLAEYR